MSAHPQSDSPSRLAWVDALRGYAILSVIAYHSCQSVPDLPDALGRILDLGSVGVPLFFMVSAFTIFLTLERSFAAGQGAGDFYIRRAFRILPLFYLVLLLKTLPPGGDPGAGFPWAGFLATLTFAGAWIPAHAATLVPGGWSISAEMWFYLAAPLLVLRIRTLHHALWFALAAIAFRCAVNESLIRVDALTGRPSAAFAAFLYFWLPNQLPMFALGAVAYHAGKSLGRTARERALLPEANAPGFSMARGGHGLFFLCAGAYLIAACIQGFKALLPFHVLFGFGFLLVFLHLMIMPGSPVANRPMAGLGRISYSAYFAHFMVIEHTGPWILPLLREAAVPPALQFLGFLASTLVLTTVASILLYRWVELPGQALGRAIIHRTRIRAGTAPLSAG